MISLYKKTILSALVVVALGMNAVVIAGCSPCQAAAAAREAARKSKQDAIAAAIAAGQQASREVELDQLDPENMTLVEACCELCEKTGQYCGGEYSAHCKVCQRAKSIQIAAATLIVAQQEEMDAADIARAPREALNDPCNTCQTCVDEINFCELAICCPNAVIPASN